MYIYSPINCYVIKSNKVINKIISNKSNKKNHTHIQLFLSSYLFKT